MNLCDVYIEKIIEVRTYDNYVIAILDTDCWGCKRKGERVFFSKEEMAEESKFKVRDRVYAPFHGYGTETKIHLDKCVYPICVTRKS